MVVHPKYRRVYAVEGETILHPVSWQMERGKTHVKQGPVKSRSIGDSGSMDEWVVDR